MQHAKFSPRVVTSCESCRKLKRKCDFLLNPSGGPCSNCKMRNIGHLCTLPKEKAPKSINGPTAKKPRKGSPTDGDSPESVYSQGSASTAPTDTSPGGAISAPATLEFSPPQTFLVACVIKFFQAPEWSYCVDQEAMMTAILDMRGADPKIDHAKLALIYILCAFILVRRGAQISTSYNFKGTRAQLANFLVDMHYKFLDNTPANSLDRCATLLFRAFHDADRGRNEEGWKTMYEAVSCFNALPAFSEPSEMVRRDKTWLALCGLEATLCAITGRRAVLTLQRDVEPIFRDFKMQRRWKVLCWSRQVQLILEQNEAYDSGVTANHVLEQEVHDYLPMVDSIEGRLFPYGQIHMFVILIKLRTQRVLKMGHGSEQEQARAILLSQLVEHGSDLARSLEIFTGMGTSSSPGLSFMGSAPALALTVFQGLICIWILAAISSRESMGNRGFEQIKARIWGLLDNLRGDAKICRHTALLFDGLDLLSKSERDSETYNVRIPAQLQNGISAITKPWNDSVEKEEMSWMNFQPSVDDTTLWTFLSSQSDFDATIHTVPYDSAMDAMILS
jgi:hypothetical protein